MLLEAKKLDKSFNGVYALKGLDLSLNGSQVLPLFSDPVEGNGKSGSEKRGRTWDPFRPEEIHFPDDSGTEEMRRDPAGHDERL